MESFVCANLSIVQCRTLSRASPLAVCLLTVSKVSTTIHAVARYQLQWNTVMGQVQHKETHRKPRHVLLHTLQKNLGNMHPPSGSLSETLTGVSASNRTPRTCPQITTRVTSVAQGASCSCDMASSLENDAGLLRVKSCGKIPSESKTLTNLPVPTAVHVHIAAPASVCCRSVVRGPANVIAWTRGGDCVQA